MDVGELRRLIANADDSVPVILWNDLDGHHGEADYSTTVDGEFTLCAKLTRKAAGR